RKTGDPIFCFHVALQKKIQLKSWDHAQIPLPFSRALVLKAPPLYVSRHADETEVRQKIGEVQQILSEMRDRGDRHWDPPGPLVTPS
ncbi:MAG: hypothetical protein U0V70_19900, partial [Terriglobia bacterium]